VRDQLCLIHLWKAVGRAISRLIVTVFFALIRCFVLRLHLSFLTPRLLGNRCYREYPQDWIERRLKEADLRVVNSSRFPILYSHGAIVRQINVARSKLAFFRDKDLADSMGKTLDGLEEESREATASSPSGRLKLGFDYTIAAEAILDGDSKCSN